MAIRTLLVPFSGEGGDGSALEAAFEVAKHFHAHVQCLYVLPDISSYVYPDIGMPNPALGLYIEEFEKTSQARLGKASSLFTSLAARHGIPVEERLTASQRVSAYFQLGKGDMEQHIIRQGKLSDLIVLQGSLAPGNSPYKSWAVTALCETGKPVMLTPEGHSPPIGKTVLIAWNNSVESARALHYALPFLHKAETIYILSVDEEEAIPVGEVALYLALQGIKAIPRHVPRTERSTGLTLLHEAKEISADLLVMGAFTHTRLRQMVMGGATSHMLEHTEIPVLMAH